MKKILYLLSFLIITNYSLLITNCLSQWISQSVPVTGGTFNDMKFANANTGFIINWNYPVATLLRTTNAGYNWQNMNNWGMAHIFIVDTNCIYTSGQNNSMGKLYKSTNLGISWDSMQATTSYYSYLQFFNKDTGLISGGDSFDNFIWRTTNGGQSMQLIATYGGANPGKFHFLKEKVNGEYYGWLYYPGNRPVYKTSNSGLNWTQLPSFSNNVNGFCFINKDTGWASITNSSNFVYYTIEGGLNWTNKIMPYNSVMHYDIWFINANTGWIGCDITNKIYITTNGGNVWGTQLVNGNVSGRLFFTDSITGWAQTSINTISHTTNGGGPILAATNLSASMPNDYILYQNYPNPFNSMTNVKFQIKNSGNIRITIYDISGRIVTILINEILQPGAYQRRYDAKNLSSGIYFYRMEVLDNKQNKIYTDTKRMILLK